MLRVTAKYNRASTILSL
uniref:Uncharacterized protein n=1 Tax=Arundo donax TaxID=35708 RepID=A0A0A9HEW8_ARUDO